MPISHLSTTARKLKALEGFTLIELIVVICVVAILATAALDRLFWYQGQAEKAAMDYTATMIKSGLWMRAADLMMANHTSDIPALAEKNPINLLAQKPANYLGEIDGRKAESLQGGNWFYDVYKHQVVYVVGHRRSFMPAVPDDFTVRYGMKVIYGETELASGKNASYIAGISLVPISKYTWH
jgi:prepilin-type N-terminal cleavage/methylation domain-containing protein